MPKKIERMKKLSLSRETVRHLTNRELVGVAGASGVTCVDCCAWRETEDCPPTWWQVCLPHTHPSLC